MEERKRVAPSEKWMGGREGGGREGGREGGRAYLSVLTGDRVAGSIRVCESVEEGLEGAFQQVHEGFLGGKHRG
jgi:hypothetical protein